MLTPVRGAHKSTEVHCPNASTGFCRDEDLDEQHLCDVGAFALALIVEVFAFTTTNRGAAVVSVTGTGASIV